jgi:hypothetical protein
MDGTALAREAQKLRVEAKKLSLENPCPRPRIESLRNKANALQREADIRRRYEKHASVYDAQKPAWKGYTKNRAKHEKLVAAAYAVLKAVTADANADGLEVNENYAWYVHEDKYYLEESGKHPELAEAWSELGNDFDDVMRSI